MVDGVVTFMTAATGSAIAAKAAMMKVLMFSFHAPANEGLL
jgi:hypothetical protein